MTRFFLLALLAFRPAICHADMREIEAIFRSILSHQRDGTRVLRPEDLAGTITVPEKLLCGTLLRNNSKPHFYLLEMS